MLCLKMASRLVLVSCIVLSPLACATSDPAGSAPFVSVSLETGGFCQTQAECWTRIVAEGSGAVAVERPGGFRVVDQLVAADLMRVGAIVNEPTFRRDIAASTPACPPVADFEAILVLTAADGAHTDKQAAGCLVSDDFKDHPYRRLRVVLEELVMTHFPTIRL
jgi:hypothetical protein